MEDAEIIDLYWKRDEKAIDETDKKYGNYIFAIANNILLNVEDSKECINDTYLKTWNSIPPTRPNILKLFLAKICRNLAIDKYQYNRAKKRNVELEIIMSEINNLEEYLAKFGVEDKILSKDLAEIFNEFLSGLDSKKRTLFLDRYYSLYSVKQIAEYNKISESNVKIILMRLRNELKDMLEKRWNIE